jgi:hypothetical protein
MSQLCPSDTGFLHNKGALLMEMIKGTVCIMCGYVYDPYTKFYWPISSSSLFTITELKAKVNFCVITILLLYIV